MDGILINARKLKKIHKENRFVRYERDESFAIDFHHDRCELVVPLLKSYQYIIIPKEQGVKIVDGLELTEYGVGIGSV